MGYRIVYDPVGKVRGAEKNRTAVAALTSVCLVIFFLVVGNFWPQGKAVLQQFFFSEYVSEAVAALEEFAFDLKCGMPISDALEVFCGKVYPNAFFLAG